MITADRLASLFRPSRIALVGASDKSTFSMLAYRNLVDFGFADHTYLVNRRGAVTHGQPTVTSCKEIGEPVTWRPNGCRSRDAWRRCAAPPVVGSPHAVCCGRRQRGVGGTSQAGRAAERSQSRRPPFASTSRRCRSGRARELLVGDRPRHRTGA